MSDPALATVTFLFTDIEGSTVLLQHLGDSRYARVIADQRSILRAALTDAGGRELDAEGDSLLAVFAHPRDAVAAAVRAQRAVLSHGWPDGLVPRTRVAVHTGRPVPVADGYVGLDVHRAARMCAVGHGSQILLSAATHELVVSDPPPDAAFRDLGSYRLKDLLQPEKLFQVLHPELPEDFPPLRSLDAHVNNLPSEVSSFVGREREMVRVKQHLSTARLVTLTGAGGCGKTRLAIHVGADVLEEYPDGVWLAELAGISDAALVLRTVAAALQVREVAGSSLQRVVVAHLRPRRVLVILDNCEHLVTECARLAETLLSACPHLRVLATSREPLGIAGETTWRVPSLSFPSEDARPSFEELMQYPAVRLFVERARTVRPTFTPTQQNLTSIVEICRHLDGIPLAIELAAARVAALTADVIAARLSDRFQLLAHGTRTALPRHQTLRATIDWSYQLMARAEQELVCRLSVFAGGWTLEAAEAICGGDLTEFSVLDSLTQLVLKSLVVMDEQEESVRYRFLETIWQYASERLRDSAEHASLKTRHLDWYVRLAERAAPELRGAAQSTWVERLELEHQNLRAALEWALQSGRIEAGLRLASAVQLFWTVRSHFAEGRRWLAALLEGAGGVPPAVRADALKASGNLAVFGQGDYTEGRGFYEAGLALCRELGDKYRTAALMGNLAFVAAGEGDRATERALLEESLALRRELGDRWGIALVLHNLGRAAFRGGDQDAAEALLSESLSIWQELGDARNIAMALNNLGLVAVRQHRFGRAHTLLGEGLALRRSLGEKLALVQVLEGFADLASAQGSGRVAARLLGACEAFRDGLGAPLLPTERSDYDPVVTRVRSLLGHESLTDEWGKGRAMTFEQAIVLAAAGEEEQPRT